MAEQFPRTTYYRAPGMRSWPLAWSRATKWEVRGAPRRGVARALYEVFTELKDKM